MTPRLLPALLIAIFMVGCDANPVVAPLGLPPLPVPQDNPLTREKVELGLKLFADRRLSHNGTMSCAMCHVERQGFTSNEIATAIGMEGRSHRRNSPTLLNVAFVQRLFHDGRESTLENQVWGPLLAMNEMANPSIGHVIEKIRSLPDYEGLFERAFAGRGATMETIGQANASFERTLVSANSRFDRWFYGKEASALTAEEQTGFELFTGKAGCAECHAVGPKWSLFMDHGFHNTGIGWARSMNQEPKHKVQLAPGVFAEIERSVVDAFSEPRQNDVGRFEVTEDPADRWAYKTPTLRNVALTMPYMHDGSVPTLEAVVDFYEQGGINNPLQDARMKRLGLTADEKRLLVEFMKSLTGSDVESATAYFGSNATSSLPMRAARNAQRQNTRSARAEASRSAEMIVVLRR